MILFNDSVTVLRLLGMPANRTACIAHMLCDEQGESCCLLNSSSIPVEVQERPEFLDHDKSTGQVPADAVYNDIFKHYKEWKKDYVNPFQDGIFSEDLGAIKPNLTSFKDASTYKAIYQEHRF